MDPDSPRRPDPDRAFTRWNEAMVERYDIERYYRDAHPLVRWIERRRLAALRKLAAVEAGERLLEVGCGAGHVLERFPSHARTTGIDLSPSMLERARGRLEAGTGLARAAAEALPFPAGAFDVVLCTEVLEHTRDPRAVMEELVRVAGEGGRVVVSVPHETRIDRAKRILRRIPGLRAMLRTLAAEDNEWHLHRLDRDRLLGLAEGLASVERLRAIPFPVLAARYVALLRPHGAGRRTSGRGEPSPGAPMAENRETS